jgi:hypothetical protein
VESSIVAVFGAPTVAHLVALSRLDSNMDRSCGEWQRANDTDHRVRSDVGGVPWEGCGEDCSERALASSERRARKAH